MYGCEAWALRKEQRTKIQATQMNALRRDSVEAGTGRGVGDGEEGTE